MLLTTGAEPRRLSVLGAELEGIYYLRTLADCEALRERLGTGGRVVVVGAGWIGSEVAASARQGGLDATLIDPVKVPMIKVPGTEAGLAAIEQLTRRGVNVNVTLLFSIKRYEQVIDAYLRGLTARAQAAEPLANVRSVASFFLSRIDTKVDEQLPDDSPLHGQVAIASARVAYQRYLGTFAGDPWERLEADGANPQRLLWASTGTKSPDYSDTMYVEELIGPDVVNTMPESTLRAFADHGTVARTLDADPDAAEQTLGEAAQAGIDLALVTAELEREGLRAFCDSYDELLDCIARKRRVMVAS